MTATGASRVDTDVHHAVNDFSHLVDYMPIGLRPLVDRSWAQPLAQHGYKPIRAETGAGPRATPAACVSHLEERGFDIGILNGTVFNLGAQPNCDVATAVAAAVNDYTREEWLADSPSLRGLIVVAPQDPAAAVREIERLGDDERFVGVLIGSGTESLLGRRAFHPIYEICTRYDLPVTFHFGGEGAGWASQSTAAGHAATFFEWHAALPQSYMAHLLSLVSEGVFSRFPELRVTFAESGVMWLGPLMWRFDKNWKGQRAEAPWLVAPPSEYIRHHVFLGLCPLEACVPAGEVGQLLDMSVGATGAVFGSSFPEHGYAARLDLLDLLPDPVRQSLLEESPRRLYGSRLPVTAPQSA